MKNITFEGHKVAYNAKAITSWKVQRLMSKGGADAFEAIDIVLGGKADEVAEQLGGDMDTMARLIAAIVENEGDSAKN